jgi:hypothetical protein
MPKTHVPRAGETAAQCRERIIRRRKLGAFAVLVCAVVLILVLSYTVFFPMTAIEIEGTTRYSRSDLESAAALKLRTQLLNIETNRIEQKLLDELPYLESVKVRRSLPHTLVITVEDAKTMVYVKISEGYLVMSGEGKILELTDKKPQNALMFEMEEPSLEKIGGKVVFDEDSEKNNWTRQVFDAMIDAYENCEYKTEITSLDMKNPYYPTMTYQNRIVLCLGSRDSFAQELAFAQRTIAALDKEDMEKKRKPSKGKLDLKVDGQSFFRAEE